MYAGCAHEIDAGANVTDRCWRRRSDRNHRVLEQSTADELHLGPMVNQLEFRRKAVAASEVELGGRIIRILILTGTISARRALSGDACFLGACALVDKPSHC
jgi:hypothetical protein